MKRAPACRFFVGRSRIKLYFLGLAWLLGTLVCAAWWVLAVRSDWRTMLVLAAVALSSIVVAWAASRSTQGQLRWDGKEWWFERAQPDFRLKSEQQCTPTVHLDLQFFMLLSLQTDGANKVWLWADRATESKGWHGMRCALYAAVAPADDVAASKIARNVRRLSQ